MALLGINDVMALETQILDLATEDAQMDLTWERGRLARNERRQAATWS
jgi:hypothetical protein